MALTWREEELENEVYGLKARIAKLEEQKKQDRTMYETLLRESYDVTMNACKCGRGKRPAYALCKVCRIAELEAEARGGDIMAEKDAERIAELQAQIELARNIVLRQEAEIARLTKPKRVHSCDIPGCVSCGNPEGEL